MTTDENGNIGERLARLEEIAETLEEGEVGLEQAQTLREEADEQLATLREALDVGDGEIIEVSGEDAGTTSREVE
jgi:exodeoxyribonuclease VII small subunit